MGKAENSKIKEIMDHQKYLAAYFEDEIIEHELMNYKLEINKNQNTLSMYERVVK